MKGQIRLFLAIISIHWCLLFVDSLPVSHSPSTSASDSLQSSTISNVASSSTATSSAKKTKMLRLEDIPSDGIDVTFRINKVYQRIRKGLGEMVDPSKSYPGLVYRPQEPNESNTVYNRRKRAFSSKYERLQKDKEAIYAARPSDTIKAEEAWQQYLRHRADVHRHQNLLIRVRERMTKANIIHPDASRHVQIEQRGDDLFRIKPIQRRPRYEARKRRADRYRLRILDPSFQPMKDPAERGRASRSAVASDKGVSGSAPADASTSGDSMLGFKVVRKLRSIRQPFVETSS